MFRIPFTSLCAVAALVALSVGGCKPDYEFPPADNDAPFPNPPPDVNPVQTDRVVQVAQPEVDVLFVVDNSCSMSEEQTALADNFPAFIAYFLVSGIDFHLGVTSTDTFSSNSVPGTQGKLRPAGGYRFIDADTPNPGAVFATMTNMGTGGHYDEMGRDAAYTAIEEKRDAPANVDFYRDDASMHFVFVSDEEDLSTNNPVSRTEFIEWMHNLKFATDMTVAHGIYFIPGTNCSTAYPPAGTAYNAYVNQTNGTKQSICTQDWEPFLDALGLQTSGLRREFFLTRIPVTTPWTIDVRVKTGNIELGFESCDGALDVPEDCEVVYNASRNSVTFLDDVPDPFSEVLITYNVEEQFTAQ